MGQDRSVGKARRLCVPGGSDFLPGRRSRPDAYTHRSPGPDAPSDIRVHHRSRRPVCPRNLLFVVIGRYSMLLLFIYSIYY